MINKEKNDLNYYLILFQFIINMLLLSLFTTKEIYLTDIDDIDNRLYDNDDNNDNDEKKKNNINDQLHIDNR